MYLKYLFTLKYSCSPKLHFYPIGRTLDNLIGLPIPVLMRCTSLPMQWMPDPIPNARRPHSACGIPCNGKILNPPCGHHMLAPCMVRDWACATSPHTPTVARCMWWERTQHIACTVHASCLTFVTIEEGQTLVKTSKSGDFTPNRLALNHYKSPFFYFY